MNFLKIFILFFSCFTFNVLGHNPEDFIITEIEQGQVLFEDEQIAEEYSAAVKRLRIRRLSAMSFQKKF